MGYVVEVSSAGEELDVGLREYREAALVLEICRTFHIDVEDALRSSVGGGKNSLLLMGEDKEFEVMNLQQAELLSRMSDARWFTEDCFGYEERKRYFDAVIEMMGIRLEGSMYMRGMH